MEHLHPATFPESLKTTLNCYRLTSIDSLSGPSGFPALAAQMWFKENKQLPPIPPQPMVQIPYLIPNDKSAKRSDTLLAGEKIACFIVGGEKRLCLPQILTSVLREYSIAEINQACADLHIYCSRCLPEQLEVLKVLGILPINTAQCGLITKTDAERLVALLMDQHEPVKSIRERLPKDIDPDSGFQVYHECFGRGYGKFYPELYVSPVSACIACDDCGYLHGPQRFIAHSHRSFEKRTCHWGFDPENWRSYLLLPKNLEDAKRIELEKLLDQMKARYDASRYTVGSLPTSTPARFSTSPQTPSKRRYDSEQESPIRKKIKEEDKMFDPSLLPHPYASLQYGVPGAMRHSAFRPWSPGLSTMSGPIPGDLPVIQDLSHLKGLLPLPFDRRGFPQYLQNGRPVVLGSRASDFPVTSAPTDARSVPNIKLAPAEEQKRATDAKKCNPPRPSRRSPSRDGIERDKNNNHQDNMPRVGARYPQKEELSRKRSLERSPHERMRKFSVSPTRLNIAEVSPRNRARVTPPRCVEPVIPVTPTSQHFSVSQSTSLSSNNNNALREPRAEFELARPVSRSREAAATAMLELKSAGSFRRRSSSSSRNSPPTSSNPKCDSWKSPTIAPTAPSTPKSTLQTTGSVVVPLDSSRQHYKWTIAGHSYIISAAGLQSLDMLRALVETECNKQTGKERIMHELVKMKSLYEEKIDIEMRVRRDLEMELEHVKSTNREKMEAMAEAKRLSRHDMENMRQEHVKRVEEMGKRLEAYRKQVEEARRGKSESEEAPRKSPAERDLGDLRSRILELEAKNDSLRLGLMEEREKREEAVMKLEEVAESSRGRISLLMESPLSRMVRGAGRKAQEEEGVRSNISSPRAAHASSSKKITSAQVPGLPVATSGAGYSQLNGILPPTFSANGQLSLMHGKSPPSDMGSPKAVVVS